MFSRHVRQLLLSCALIVGSISFATAQLNGTYTIDAGGGGDYVSVSAAVAALNDQGVSGAVTFEVTPGSGPYTEQVTVRQGGLPGLPVRFIGNGDTIQFAPSASARHIVRIDSADHVVWEGFTLRILPGDNYGWGVHISGGAENVHIRDCTMLLTPAGTSSFDGYAGVTATNSTAAVDGLGGPPAHGLEVSGCTIVGASIGINVSGDLAEHTRDVLIEDNTITQNWWRGIKMFYAETPVIRGNSVAWKNAANSGSYSIELTTGSGATIENNRLPNTGYVGIGLLQFDGSAVTPNRILNNMVGGQVRDGFFLARGILVLSSDTVSVWHNTVNQDFGEGRGIEILLSSQVDIRNNAFRSRRGSYPDLSGEDGVCLFVDDVSAVIALDHNNYDVAGNNEVARWGGVRYKTLADFLPAPGPASHDVNSADNITYPVSAIDLHETGTGLNGFALPGLAAEDIDGQARSVMPDVGADEYNPSDNNAGSVLVLSPVSGTNGTQQVIIKIANYGAAALTAVDVSAELTSERNGQAVLLGPVSISGASLASGATANINLGNVDLETDGYQIKAWTSMPNGVVDTLNNDDTLARAFINICETFTGEYFVDQGAMSSGRTYNSMQQFLDRCGSCGGTDSGLVTVSVVPGSGPYVGQTTFPNLGGDTVNRLRVNGNGEVFRFTPTTQEDGFIWRVGGIDYLTIDNVVLEAGAGSAACWNLHVLNSATNLEVYRSTFRNLAGKGYSLDFAGIGMGVYIGDDLGVGSFQCILEDNTFEDGAYGLFTGSPLSIKGNTFLRQSCYGLDVRYMRNASVVGNRFDLAGPSTGNTCLRILDGSNISVTENVCTGWNSRGLFLDNIGFASSSDTNNVVANNVMMTVDPTGAAKGIQVDGGRYMRINNNTIAISSPGGGGGHTGFWTSSQITGFFDFRNNIVSITGPAFLGKVMQLDGDDDPRFFDNNCYYAPNLSTFGQNGSVAYTVFGAWKIVLGVDLLFSFEADPLLSGPEDPHLDPASPAIDAGAALAEVSIDFEGGMRPFGSAWDIGADEFGTSALCPVPINLLVTGLLPTSATLSWDPVPEAVAYQLQGRKASGGVVKTFTLPGTSSSFFTFQPATSYQWRLRSYCPTDTSDYTAIQAFTTPSARTGESSLRLWPNPARDQVNIQSPSLANSCGVVAVHSADGRMALQRSTCADATGRATLFLDALPASTYALTWIGSEELQHQRFMVGAE